MNEKEIDKLICGVSAIAILLIIFIVSSLIMVYNDIKEHKMNASNFSDIDRRLVDIEETRDMPDTVEINDIGNGLYEIRKIN